MGAFQERIQTLESELARAASSTAAADAAIDGRVHEAELRLAALQAQAEAAAVAAARIADLEGEVRGREAECAALSGQVAELKAALELAQAAVAAAESNGSSRAAEQVAVATAMQAQLEAMESEAARLQGLFQEKIAQLEVSGSHIILSFGRGCMLACIMGRCWSALFDLSISVNPEIPTHIQPLVQARDAELGVLREHVTLLQADSEDLRHELAVQHEESERLSHALAASEAEGVELRRAAAEHASAASELLAKAEVAAEAMGRHLDEMLTQKTELAELRAWKAKHEVAILEAQEAVKAAASALTEQDAEAMLDEIDALRQEVEMRAREGEEAARRAAEAEEEVTTLRQQLHEGEAGGKPGGRSSPADSIPGTELEAYSRGLIEEVAEARAAVAAAQAATEAMRVRAESAEATVAKLRVTAAAEADAVAARVLGGAKSAAGVSGAIMVELPGGGHMAVGELVEELVVALEQVEELEASNAQLANALVHKEALLSQSRTFIEGYLEQTKRMGGGGLAGAGAGKFNGSGEN